MLLKIRSLAFILLLAMLFSGVVCGKNLLIGGIDQDQKEISDNAAFASQIHANYEPTYTEDKTLSNAQEVRDAALDKPTKQNGLDLSELKGQSYDTIVAYSGGTASAITALDPKSKQGVTCNTLILISPMSAGVPDWYLVAAGVASGVAGTVAAVPGAVLGAATGPAAPVAAPVLAVFGFTVGAGAMGMATTPLAEQLARDNYQAQINRILSSNPPVVKNIIVIQSEKDKLPLDYVYQARFPQGTKNVNGIQITVHNVDLKGTGKDAHIELFTYAKANLKTDKTDNTGKVYYVPDQPTLNQESNAFKKPSLASLFKPGLLPPSWDKSSDSNLADIPRDQQDNRLNPGIGEKDDWDPGDAPFTEDYPT
jgi:hypothetical protein